MQVVLSHSYYYQMQNITRFQAPFRPNNRDHLGQAMPHPIAQLWGLQEKGWEQGRNMMHPRQGFGKPALLQTLSTNCQSMLYFRISKLDHKFISILSLTKFDWWLVGKPDPCVTFISMFYLKFSSMFSFFFWYLLRFWRQCSVPRNSLYGAKLIEESLPV